MAALVAALICLVPLFSTNTAQAAGGDVVSVADYGAAADSGEDSAPAIIKAVDKAKELAAEGKNVTIAFPKGRYDIYPDKAEQRTLYVSNTVGTNSSYKDKKIGILLEDTKNITVDGQGSDFVFHGKMTTFAAINSRNVTFKNFSVDFQVPTVIDLTVEKVDAGAKTACTCPRNTTTGCRARTSNGIPIPARTPAPRTGRQATPCRTCSSMTRRPA